MGVLTVGPIADPASYNRIIIAGVDTSKSDAGVICVLEAGGGREFVWDQKQTAGAQGFTTTYRGWKPSDGIKFRFLLWTPAQQDDFYQRIYPIIKIDAEKSEPKPVDIYHPVLFANDIFWVVTDDIGPLVDEGKQLWTVTVTFREYRQAKPKNVTTTPNNANNAAGGANTKPSVTDDLQREIEAARREFEKPE